MSNNSHGKKLEPQLRELHAKLSSLGINDDLFKIIHSPGWTTFAEIFFVESLINQIDDTHALLVKKLNVLNEGSKLIK